MKSSRQDFLKSLKEYGREQNIPQITEKNAQFICFLIRLKKASSILEIGTAHGYSTIYLADSIQDQKNPRFVGIDISLPSYKVALENIKQQKLDSFVRLYWGNALEVLPTIQKKFDVVFIDAQKSLYLDFWKKIQPHLKEDSLIIFDDILKFREKTRPLSQYFEKQTLYEALEIPIDEDDGILLVQKKRTF